MSKTWYNYPKGQPLDKCRYCEHAAAAHIEIKDFGTKKQKVRWHGCERANYKLGCRCPGFEPLDNLLYLECKDDDKSSAL